MYQLMMKLCSSLESEGSDALQKDTFAPLKTAVHMDMYDEHMCHHKNELLAGKSEYYAMLIGSVKGNTRSFFNHRYLIIFHLHFNALSSIILLWTSIFNIKISNNH